MRTSGKVRAWSITVAALATVTLSGCGSGEPDAPAAPTAPTSSPADDAATPAVTGPVQFRVVTEVNPPSPDLDCAAEPQPVFETPAAKVVTACDRLGVAYVLEPAAFVGGVQEASAELSSAEDWLVDVRLDDEGTAAFADLTGLVAGTGRQVAVVVGGRVVSAPSVQEAITGGEIRLSGSLSRDEAEALAAALEAGG